jgi:uncharacterized protein (UPF0264 family)
MRAAGADLIDLKDPVAGALGGLPPTVVAKIVTDCAGSIPISATIGDLPLDPAQVIPKVEALATAGVDFIKIGWFPGADPDGVLAALRPLVAREIQLVAVILADLEPSLANIDAFAVAGFKGIMLDTADKKRGSLLRVVPPSFVQDFVRNARQAGLLSGLAGSLRIEDIPMLVEMEPDFMGFRGALCGGDRTAGIDILAARRVVETVRAACPLSNI